MTTPKQTCFVVMGFGEKVDFQSGRKLNLDAAYRSMIKPAVEEAGLECYRADEIVHSGVIDVPMYQQILTADVVIADLLDFQQQRLLRTRRAACAPALHDHHRLKTSSSSLLTSDISSFGNTNISAKMSGSPR